MQRFWLICAIFVLAAATAGQALARAPETVLFGGDLDYPPYERLEDGEAVGFHIDVEDAMARAGGARAEHRLGPWPDMVQALRDGTVDVVPMFRSDERERYFWFSEPIYFAYHAIFTRDDPGNVTGLDDLEGWRVAVERSSYAHDQFAAAGHRVDLVLVGTTLEAVQALADGDADYAVLVTGPTTRLAQRQSLPAMRVGTPVWPREYAFAVRRDRPEVIEWVESSLDRIVSSGEYQRIYARWEERIEPRDADEPAFGADWLRAAAALVIFLVLAATMLLRRYRSAYAAERHKRSVAEEDISFLMNHDAITRLPSRQTFQEDVDTIIRDMPERKTLDLIVLKLLNFNEIAKKHGRSVLDDWLRLIAEELLRTSLAAGYLADSTFAVLVDSFDTHNLVTALNAASKAADIAEEPQIVWGTARFPEQSDDAHDLLHKAELALGNCIARGQNSLVYHHSLEPNRRDLRLIADFESFGRREIYAVYQPQLDLNSGTVGAAEALVRWNHPERGLIPPAEFIPLIEGAGLISFVTNRVVDEAVRQSVRFRQLGLPCRFSVNVSVHDLLDRDLPELLASALRKHGADPADLVIELTESVAVEEPARVRAILQQLKGMGIGTAIDDFGTGFSSLVNLTEIPFDELKIDRLFVSQMLDSQSHRSAVRSVIEMAHAMNMEVVAEGAPDAATIEALKTKGCDRVQGYAVSPPISETELMRFIANWRKWARYGSPRAVKG